MKARERLKTTYGVKETQEFENFILNESRYISKSKMLRHCHSMAHISVLLKGSFTENYGFKTRINKSSALILHPPNEEHSVEFHNSGAQILSVHLKPHFSERLRDFTKILDKSTVFQSDTPVLIVRQLFLESHKNDEVTPLMCESLVLELVSTASRCAKPSELKIPQWLHQVKDFLHANFSETITLEEIAGISGVHPIHLARVFRQKNGCSVGEYIRRLRIEYASRQLAKTDTPLNEIALASGFSDQSHLTRSFRNYLKVTPSEYRRISRLS